MAGSLTELVSERILPYAPRPKAARPPSAPDGTPYPAATRPPVCFGYCRVSLEKQGKGTSLTSQAERIREEYERRYKTTHPDFRLLEESESAAALRFGHRPMGVIILDNVQPGDVLIVAKLDRFSRRLVDGLAELRDLCRRGVRVLCLDLGPEPIAFDDGTGEIILTLMLWVAQYERKRIVERCTEGQRRARAERKGTDREWKRPESTYGFRKVGKRLIPDPEWREYTRTLADLYDFCRRTLGYTKCDKRFLMLCERYDLRWYPKYSLEGTAGERTRKPQFITCFRWFTKEEALQEKERKAGLPPPLPVARPWRTEYDSGTFEQIPELVYQPFYHTGPANKTRT